MPRTSCRLAVRRTITATETRTGSIPSCITTGIALGERQSVFSYTWNTAGLYCTRFYNCATVQPRGPRGPREVRLPKFRVPSNYTLSCARLRINVRQITTAAVTVRTSACRLQYYTLESIVLTYSKNVIFRKRNQLVLYRLNISNVCTPPWTKPSSRPPDRCVASWCVGVGA